MAVRGGRSTNPTAVDGDVSRCFICSSKFHWARSCPDLYENKEDEVVAVATDETEVSPFVTVHELHKREAQL